MEYGRKAHGWSGNQGLAFTTYRDTILLLIQSYSLKQSMATTVTDYLISPDTRLPALVAQVFALNEMTSVKNSQESHMCSKGSLKSFK
jgi:hypothetical protein